MTGTNRIMNRNKRRSSQSSVAMRYLAAIDRESTQEHHQPKYPRNNSDQVRLLTQSPRSRSSYGKSVKTSKTSLSGTTSSVLDQSNGSLSVEGSWTAASPSHAVNSSQDLTTPGSVRTTEKTAKLRKRHWIQGSTNLSKEVRNYPQQFQQGSPKSRMQYSGSTTLFSRNDDRVVAEAEDKGDSAQRSDSSNNSSLSSPRTPESPIPSGERVAGCHVHQQGQYVHQHDSFSSPYEESSTTQQSRTADRSGFLEKSFDVAVQHSLDLILDNAAWANCTAPISPSCSPDGKFGHNRRVSRNSKLCTSKDSTEATSATTTPTSTSSRDHRNFTYKLSKSFSSSSIHTEAATEVATNRAIDLAMKRIRAIEEKGQSAIAVKEARDALLKREVNSQRFIENSFHPAMYGFSQELNAERKAMGARSLLSLSSNESSRKDLSDVRRIDASEALRYGRLGSHVAQQQRANLLSEGEESSLQSRSMASSLGVQVAAFRCPNKSHAAVSQAIPNFAARSSLVGEAVAAEVTESYNHLDNLSPTQNLLLPDLYEGLRGEKSTILGNGQLGKGLHERRTFRVVTPTFDMTQPVFNAVSPCISPPEIIRHSRSFEEQSPDPIFCTNSASMHSSNAGLLYSSSRAGSSIAHSFGSDDAMFMTEGSAVSESPSSHRSGLYPFTKKATNMPTGFSRPYRLHNIQTTAAKIDRSTVAEEPIQAMSEQPHRQTFIEHINSNNFSTSPGRSYTRSCYGPLASTEPSILLHQRNPPPPPPLNPAIPSLITAPSLVTSKIETATNSDVKSKGHLHKDFATKTIPIGGSRSSSKVAQSFLAAISTSQSLRKHWLFNAGHDDKASCNETSSESRSKARISLSAHLARSDDNLSPCDHDLRSVDVQSIRSTFETRNATPTEELDDDSGSVRSLKERFEVPLPKPETGLGIAKMRSVFEPKKPPSVKGSQTRRVAEVRSKFESQTGRHLLQANLKGQGSIIKPRFNPSKNTIENGNSRQETSQVPNRCPRSGVPGNLPRSTFGNAPVHVRASSLAAMTSRLECYDSQTQSSEKVLRARRDFEVAGEFSTLSRPNHLINIDSMTSANVTIPVDVATQQPPVTDVIGSSFHANRKVFSGFQPKSVDVEQTPFVNRQVMVAPIAPIGRTKQMGVSTERNFSLTQVDCPGQLSNLQLVSARAALRPSSTKYDVTNIPTSMEISMHDEHAETDNGKKPIAVPFKSMLEPKPLDIDHSESSTNRSLCPSSEPLNEQPENEAEDKVNELDLNVSSQLAGLTPSFFRHDAEAKSGNPTLDVYSIPLSIGASPISSRRNSNMRLVSGEVERGGIVAKDARIFVKPVPRKPNCIDHIAQPISIQDTSNPKLGNPSDGISTALSGHRNPFRENANLTHQARRPSAVFRQPAELFIANSGVGYPLPKVLQVGTAVKHAEVLDSVNKNGSNALKPARMLEPSFLIHGNTQVSSRNPLSTVDDSSFSGHEVPYLSSQAIAGAVEAAIKATETAQAASKTHNCSSTNRLLSDESNIPSLAADRDVGNESESEFSDGVTLDVSIAEVSNLTNPTAIWSKTCDRSVSTNGDDFFGDPRSVDLNESEAKRSEASSSQTSEAAHPLIAKAMRLLPMSDEFSSDSFFRTRSLIARHWGNSSSLELGNRGNSRNTLGFEEKKDDTMENDDPFGGWDMERIASSFPMKESKQEEIKTDTFWSPFSLSSTSPSAGDATRPSSDSDRIQPSFASGDFAAPVESPEKVLAKNSPIFQLKPSEANSSHNSSRPKSGAREEARSDALRLLPLSHEATSSPRSSTCTLVSGAKTVNGTRARVNSTKRLVDSAGESDLNCGDSSHASQDCGGLPQTRSKHAAVMARLTRLKASRIRRAVAQQTLRPRFRPYGSRISDNDESSLHSRGSSTRFGGSSFLASLDVD